jgi:Putative transposase
VIYDLLFKAAADTTLTIAADPKHLGAKIGITAALHTWGSAMTHHPHLHMIVPGGGLSLDGQKWLACRPGFFLPVRLLSRLFRRLFLKMLADAHAAGRLAFFGDHAALANAAAFAALLRSLRKAEWVVYAKKPFGGPQAVLAYLARRQQPADLSRRDRCYIQVEGLPDRGAGRYNTMNLPTREFIRRFLIHVLPKGLHRIRHYGLFANGKNRAANIARTRHLLAMPQSSAQHNIDPDAESDQPRALPNPCPCCGGRMITIEAVHEITDKSERNNAEQAQEPFRSPLRGYAWECPIRPSRKPPRDSSCATPTHYCIRRINPEGGATAKLLTRNEARRTGRRTAGRRGRPPKQGRKSPSLRHP